MKHNISPKLLHLSEQVEEFMVALTSEYLLWVAVRVILLFVVGHIILQQFYTASSVPRVDFEVVKAVVVRKSPGVYFEFVIQFRTNTKVCVNFIELKDISTGYTLLAGDKGVNEVSNLPVCVDPYTTFTLGDTKERCRDSHQAPK